MSYQRLARSAAAARAVAVAAGLCLGALASPGALAAETASLPKEAAVELPGVLSNADRARYRKIFAIQEHGDWRGADKLIAKLVDLARWLKQYADHPDARRIHKLALSRKPRNYRAPTRPNRKFYPSYQSHSIIEHSGYRPSRKSARRIISQVRRMSHRRQLSQASRYIGRKKIRQTLGATGYDLARTHIASGWFFHGDRRAPALCALDRRAFGLPAREIR